MFVVAVLTFVTRGRPRKLPKHGTKDAMVLERKLFAEIGECGDVDGAIKRVAKEYGVREDSLKRWIRGDPYLKNVIRDIRVIKGGTDPRVIGSQLEILTSFAIVTAIIELGKKFEYQMLELFRSGDHDGVDIIVQHKETKSVQIAVECKNWDAEKYLGVMNEKVADREIFDRFKHSAKEYGEQKHKVIVWGGKPELDKNVQAKLDADYIEIVLGEQVDLIKSLIDGKHFWRLVEEFKKLL